ncbi:hypothetical protein EMIHUDRAFT_443621, partial [Emiliania huxleyi CCMP1516]|uniref:Uncharacterized protein n=2 Tax=Emiliania huxleyi TaxID=2903 RepID=A0A0D3JPL3_EMIH1
MWNISRAQHPLHVGEHGAHIDPAQDRRPQPSIGDGRNGARARHPPPPPPTHTLLPPYTAVPLAAAGVIQPVNTHPWSLCVLERQGLEPCKSPLLIDCMYVQR